MPMSAVERASSRHALHSWALATPFLSFPVLYLFPWNPIYPGNYCHVYGCCCRDFLPAGFGLEDVDRGRTFSSLLHGLFDRHGMVRARLYRKGVELKALSGLTIVGMPIEELLFAAGAFWSGVYDHFTWKILTPRQLFAGSHV